jgi:PAS domain S-box-containing protein
VVVEQEDPDHAAHPGSTSGPFTTPPDTAGRFVAVVATGASPTEGISDAQLTSEAASALVEANPDGMIVVDEAGLVLLANQKIEELFGFDRTELIGQPVETLVPDRMRQLHAAHRTRYRGAPEGRPMGAGLDLYGRRRDGTEFPVEISLSPIVTASGLRIIACIRDISERRAADLERRRHERQLSIMEDRERIAADLHDRVIQRLFATGMGLQATSGRIADEAIARRVDAAVGELDETITELRSAIFRLSERSEAEPFGERVRGLVARFGARLGFDPALRMSGDVDEVPGAVIEQLVPTLEEALSNVARHARASAVTVELAVDDDEVRLSVRDDGIGIAPDAVSGGGLKSLRARAERLGGTCEIETPPGGGTTVTWRVSR